MEINEIIETTLDLLSKNTEWEERYAKYIKYLKDKQPKRFIKPKGLSVYSSVSGYKGETYDLRFDGQSVGLVVSRLNKVLLYPRDEANEKYFGFKLEKECVGWHSQEATKFRSFFRNLANESSDIKLKSPEHRVENCLLKEFAKRTRKEGKELTNIQPIKLNGCFFQMPTPLKASNHNPTYAKQNGGGIDILSRIIIKRESRICVMEVKDENKDSESQAKAMEQAISYAVFIAKLLRSKSGQTWWDFLMGGKSVSSSRILSDLNIDVVTIMPAGHTEEFVNEVIDIHNLATEFHCYSLYYDNDIFANGKGKFVFTGTFLEHLNK